MGHNRTRTSAINLNQNITVDNSMERFSKKNCQMNPARRLKCIGRLKCRRPIKINDQHRKARLLEMFWKNLQVDRLEFQLKVQNIKQPMSLKFRL